MVNLDEMDRRIIDELRRDGRQANTDIARKLGVGETMIRHRIRKLKNWGVIQIAARVNLAALGYDTSAIIGLVYEAADGAKLSDVTRRIQAMPEVRFLSIVTGRYDLLFNACFPSRDEFLIFLNDRIRTIPGVSRLEVLNELKVVKRDSDFQIPSVFPVVGEKRKGVRS